MRKSSKVLLSWITNTHWGSLLTVTTSQNPEWSPPLRRSGALCVQFLGSAGRCTVLPRSKNADKTGIRRYRWKISAWGGEMWSLSNFACSTSYSEVLDSFFQIILTLFHGLELAAQSRLQHPGLRRGCSLSHSAWRSSQQRAFRFDVRVSVTKAVVRFLLIRPAYARYLRTLYFLGTPVSS